MDKNNPEVDMVEGRSPADEKSRGPLQESIGVMRAKSDDLSVWQTVRLYKLAGIIAMAAFKLIMSIEINLNGGIVSNKGFIQLMAGGGKTIIAGKYISAWGGIQSAGQTIGQLLIQYATEAYGRKVSLMIILLMFITSVMTESFATHWQHWLVAKLLSGMGVGMLQCTMPLYLAEVAPTQLRGVFINAYTFWFVLGQLFASVALYELKATDPTDFRTPIYTQDVMDATIQMEKDLAAKNKEEDMWEVFRGRNLIRFIICSWPKITQQFVGLAVFNTYATYFFLALGIIGCFDYTGKTLSSLLIFFACLATFSTTGASAIGYAYAAEMPQQRLRARTSAWALAASNAISVMFSFCTPIMINGDKTHWGVKTAFFFAGTGTFAVFIAWLILPEVARRTPAEIDELFEKRVPLRQFKGYVTEVEMRATEVQHMSKMGDL
ncbi:hypothetical protein ACHAQA_001449 [Verticillium albo-atrum]